MFETDIQNVLKAINSNRVWWLKLPDGQAVVPTQPAIILSKPGGKSSQYVEKDLVPSHKHTRLQVTIWGDEMLAWALARLVQDTLVKSAFVIEVIGAPFDEYDQDGNLAGCNQLFGVWYPDP